MKTKWMAALLLSLTLTGAAMADGAPEAQFGYSGWPYRQSTDCNANGSNSGQGRAYTVPPNLPSAPGATVPPVEPPVCAPPVLPGTKAPTPVVTPAPEASPEPTAQPEVTASPKPTPKPTSKPTPAPQATATKAPAITPAPSPTSTPEGKPTEKPTIPTVTPSAGDDYTTPSITKQEEIAFLLLNQDREANGRTALILDPVLCSIARIKSCDMKQNKYFSHYSPTYGSASDMLRSFGYSFQSVGENIAHHATVEKAQAAFMTSTGHRNNILGKNWTRVGIGICEDDQGYVYVTQLFVK